MTYSSPANFQNHQMNIRHNFFSVNEIVAIVVIAVLVVFVGAVLLCCYFMKRRNNKEVSSEKILFGCKKDLKRTPLRKLNFNLVQEPLQSPRSPQIASESHSLQHQSRSYPTVHPLLSRTPSISSQGSFDSSSHKHRGSSPQIKTFDPEGKTVEHSTYPFRTSSRSPSPLRAASFDVRCSSTTVLERRTPSPSQSSLGSQAGGSAGSSSSPLPASPRTRALGRPHSPLLLPSSRSHTPDNSSAPPASPLGAIQPDLYLKRDDPLFIKCSEGIPLGRIHFRLSYDFNKSDLIVHIIEAHDLLEAQDGGFREPYIKVTMLPEVDSKKRETVVHCNTVNPLYDEKFKFPISYDDLESRTLIIQVLELNRCQNDAAGEIRLNLDKFTTTLMAEVWGEITKISTPPEEMRKVLVSLSYLPAAERLRVVLMEAKNLFLSEDREHFDSYAKICLITNGKRVKKKKTASRKGSNSPEWNEAISFDLPQVDLPNSAIEICIFDQSNDRVIGTITIGPKENGSERDHWFDMITHVGLVRHSWHVID